MSNHPYLVYRTIFVVHPVARSFKIYFCQQFARVITSKRYYSYSFDFAFISLVIATDLFNYLIFAGLADNHSNNITWSQRYCCEINLTLWARVWLKPTRRCCMISVKNETTSILNRSFTENTNFKLKTFLFFWVSLRASAHTKSLQFIKASKKKK